MSAVPRIGGLDPELWVGRRVFIRNKDGGRPTGGRVVKVRRSCVLVRPDNHYQTERVSHADIQPWWAQNPDLRTLADSVSKRLDRERRATIDRQHEDAPQETVSPAPAREPRLFQDPEPSAPPARKAPTMAASAPTATASTPPNGDGAVRLSYMEAFRVIEWAKAHADKLRHVGYVKAAELVTSGTGVTVKEATVRTVAGELGLEIVPPSETLTTAQVSEAIAALAATVLSLCGELRHPVPEALRRIVSTDK